MKTVANFYQTDEIRFRFVSDEWNGTTVDQFGRRRPLLSRVYDSLSQAAAENAASRVFNGVHWRFDGTEGVRAGNAIADYAFDNLRRMESEAPEVAVAFHRFITRLVAERLVMTDKTIEVLMD